LGDRLRFGTLPWRIAYHAHTIGSKRKYAVEVAMHLMPDSIALDLLDQHQHRQVLIHHHQVLRLHLHQVVVVEEEEVPMIMLMMIYTTTC